MAFAIRNKQLSINLISNFIAFAVNTGLTFLLTPYIVGKVGGEAYGFVALAFLMVNYVTIVTSALNSMVDRFISIEVNLNNIEKANIYFSSVLKANIIAAFILVAPFAFILFYIDTIFNIPVEIISDVRYTFGFVFVNIIVALTGSVFGAAVFCKNRLELSSLRAIEGNIIKLALTLLFFMLFVPKIYYITLIAVFVTLYSVLINIHYTRKLLPEIEISTKHCKVQAIKTLLGSGIWNTLNQLSSALLNGLDLLIANIFIGSYLAGQYSLAKTVPTFAIGFIVSIVAVFAPQFVVLYARKEQTKLIGSIELSIKILGIIVGVPLSFLIVFGDVFYSLWLPGEDTGILFALSNLTLIPIVIAAAVEPLTNVFMVTNKLKVPALFLTVMGTANVLGVLTLLRVTLLGIYAIPLTAFAINLIWNFVFSPLYAAHCLSVKRWTFYPSVLKADMGIVIMVTVCFIFKSVFAPVSTWVALIGMAAACGSIALAASVFISFSKQERCEIFSWLSSKRKG